MTLSAPKKITWLIALVLGVLGLLGSYGIVTALAGYSFWLVTIAWAILILATLLKDL